MARAFEQAHIPSLVPALSRACESVRARAVGTGGYTELQKY